MPKMHRWPGCPALRPRSRLAKRVLDELGVRARALQKRRIREHHRRRGMRQRRRRDALGRSCIGLRQAFLRSDPMCVVAIPSARGLESTPTAKFRAPPDNPTRPGAAKIRRQRPVLRIKGTISPARSMPPHRIAAFNIAGRRHECPVVRRIRPVRLRQLPQVVLARRRPSRRNGPPPSAKRQQRQNRHHSHRRQQLYQRESPPPAVDSRLPTVREWQPLP